MGFGESLKSLVLFGLKKGYGEVHFEEGRLPFIVNSKGHRAVINGVMPLNKDQISDAKRLFLKGSNYSTMHMSGHDFMIIDLGSGVVFRQLPTIKKPKSYNAKLASSCLSKKGAIVCVYSDQHERIFNSYQTASIAVSEKKLEMAVVETSKYYCLDKGLSNVTDIFRPDMELNVVLRISDQASFDCIFCPDCRDRDSAMALNAISSEKLVIAGISPDVKDCFSTSNIIYGIKERQKGAVIYPEAIIKNLEVEHA